MILDAIPWIGAEFPRLHAALGWSDAEVFELIRTQTPGSVYSALARARGPKFPAIFAQQTLDNGASQFFTHRTLGGEDVHLHDMKFREIKFPWININEGSQIRFVKCGFSEIMIDQSNEIRFDGCQFQKTVSCRGSTVVFNRCDIDLLVTKGEGEIYLQGGSCVLHYSYGHMARQLVMAKKTKISIRNGSAQGAVALKECPVYLESNTSLRDSMFEDCSFSGDPSSLAHCDFKRCTFRNMSIPGSGCFFDQCNAINCEITATGWRVDRAGRIVPV